MHFLAIDHGTRRVGLALGDVDSGTIAMLPSLRVRDDADAVEVVLAVAAREDVAALIVGMPASAKGGSGGKAVERVIAFIEAIKKMASLSIETEDERFTTAMVERMRKDAGVHAKHFDKDSAAAVAIAEGYLHRIQRKTKDMDDGLRTVGEDR